MSNPNTYAMHVYLNDPSGADGSIAANQWMGYQGGPGWVDNQSVGEHLVDDSITLTSK